ncbi:MAG: type II toxin-antitoxin system Phd/YefM family antitoxin [Candidatus Promineofilum sp.]|uniref:type II toxin-antitoxin system Phd/YefM family antitoxin n=1 Tax=Promineifilum sp. TaxID=2664178 RepID=UPI0024121558|nr:type II toxin-antitoxin system Phd/YefM family antitoxin [Promineifilum sp.]
MKTPIYLGGREARSQFADLIGRVHYGGETIIVERSGKPMAAVIPIDLYERLVAEREARFAVIDDLRRKAAGIPTEEILSDVSEAIDAIRAGD